jgi:hypothetical protein
MGARNRNSNCHTSSRLVDLANVCFRIVPRAGISAPKVHRRLVLLGIILFHPKQFINSVYRILHDVFHLGVRYVRVFRFTSTSGAFSSTMNVFDRPITERQCNEAFGFPGQRGVQRQFSFVHLRVLQTSGIIRRRAAGFPVVKVIGSARELLSDYKSAHTLSTSTRL